MESLIALVMLSSVCWAEPAGQPVRRAHAHNDYEHARPLHDALDAGFCSVEADIWLVDSRLLVAHTPAGLKNAKTLEVLYLDPLRERAKANHGEIQPKVSSFWLLIDIKTEAKATFAALSKVLESYSDILTVTREGKNETKAVTVVISGNRDQEAIAKQAVRYCGIDGRSTDLASELTPDLMPWISANWLLQFNWNGQGTMPADELDKLHKYVASVHKAGRRVRFWGTPESPELWRTLLKADVDLINTDKLTELRDFLLKEDLLKKSSN